MSALIYPVCTLGKRVVVSLPLLTVTGHPASPKMIFGGMCQLGETTESPLYLQSPRTTLGPSRRPWMSPSTKRVIALALSSEVSSRVGCGEWEQGNDVVSEPSRGESACFTCS